MIDPIQLTQDLIKCPSVTPKDEGALGLVEDALSGLGFQVQRKTFQSEGLPAIDNLYAKLGDKNPVLCFAGHTDVVPAGDERVWSHPPFAANIKDGKIWGRGAADMKSAIACFIAACENYLKDNKLSNGSIALLITGDEEAHAINGTDKMLKWLKAQGERIDDCLVGEPSCPERLGEMMKIGRRGSLSANLTIKGKQGHVAYPKKAQNPLPELAKCAHILSQLVLDEGSAYFQPSNLEVTTIDVANPAYNVIPNAGFLQFNIRYNDHWTQKTLEQHLDNLLSKMKLSCDFRIQYLRGGDCFLTKQTRLTDIVRQSVKRITNIMPALSTMGGTSDARFIKDYANVVEFGLVGKTIHQIDEHVAIEDIKNLTKIYEAIIASYFSSS